VHHSQAGEPRAGDSSRAFSLRRSQPQRTYRDRYWPEVLAELKRSGSRPRWRRHRPKSLFLAHDAVQGVCASEEDSRLRLFFIDELVKFDDETRRAAIAVLLQRLQSRDPPDVLEATVALARFGPKASLAIPALIKLAEGMEAGPGRSDDSGLAFFTFKTIHEVGNGNDPVLIDALKRMLGSKGRVLGTGAISALGSLIPAPKGVVPALLAAMKDQDPVVRGSACDALGRYVGSKGDTVLHALSAAMGDPDLWVRISAGRSLASLGEAAAEAIPPIIRLLRSEHRTLRSQAAVVLGKFGPSARVACAALLVALDDEKEYVRNSAEEALNAVSPIESETALGRVAPGDEKAIEALGLALAGDPDVDVRNAAARCLGWMGPQAAAAVPVMIRALNDGDGTVRVHVMVGLGRIGLVDGSVAPVLKTIAERDPSADFRIWAIRALGLMGGESSIVVPTLLKMLDDANGDIRNAAAYQLGEIRTTGVVLPALPGKLNDGKPTERSLAAFTLGMLGREVATEALPALIRALRDEDDEVRKGAVTSLMEFGEAAAAAAPALRAALDDRCPAIRSDAELALKCIAGEAGVGIIRSAAW
jgi:HEAT repeat protein